MRARGHHEILVALLYGIERQQGVMALIGDVGTGKTTLCRALLAELPTRVGAALVLNPFLTGAELMAKILDDLGAERGGSTMGELMGALDRHLAAAEAAGKGAVVILDEAQQMSVEALEQIRLLSTLETPTAKRLQIALVGQPELGDKLRRRELRQLDQRIGVRCHLRPLSRRDTSRYVEHRLRVAGLTGIVPFRRRALGEVYRSSGGVPRMINRVCDQALTLAFGARTSEVTPALVRLAARDVKGEQRARRWPRRVAFAGGAAAVLALAGASVIAHRDGASLGALWLPGPAVS